MIENKQPGNESAYRIIVMLDAPHFDEIADACKQAGHEVVRVNSTEALVAFLDSKDHADLVVSGVHLENGNVFELLVSIRSDQRHKDVRIMLICTEPSPTAISINESTASAAKALGADSYLFVRAYDKERILREIESELPAVRPARRSDPTNAY